MENKLPENFDWKFYLEYYEDLRNAGLKTKEDAEAHYLNHGQYENRIYKITSMSKAESANDKNLDTQNRKGGKLKIKITASIKSLSGYGNVARNIVDQLLDLDFVDVYLNEIESFSNEKSDRVSNNNFKKYDDLKREYDYYDFNIVIHSLDENLICSKSFKNCFLWFWESHKLNQNFKNFLLENPDVIILSTSNFMKEILDYNNITNKFYKVSHIHKKNKIRYYAMCQDVTRKNIKQTIDCFLKCFEGVDDVEYHIKISRYDRDLNYWNEYLKNQNKIKLYTNSFTEEEVETFHKENDIFYLCQHSEGYGVPHLDSINYGNEIVTNNFGSLKDYLNENNSYLIPFRVDKADRKENVERNCSFYDEDMEWALFSDDDIISKLKESYLNKKNKVKINDNENTVSRFLIEETKDMIISDKLTERFNRKNKNNKPLVTLITSVKNAYDYLEQFFENTINQTIFKQCEWIIIDVNDTDKDYSIIKKYLTHKNIFYEKIKEDNGLYSIWNYMIKKSESNFISNFNCDDRRFENSLECQLKTLLVSDCDVVFSDALVTTTPNITTQNLNDIVGTDNPHFYKKYINTEIGKLPLWYNSENIEDITTYNIIHNGPMWRKKLHFENGFFDETFISAGDWDFWLRCYFNNCRFKKIKEILGIYFFNPNGISTSEKNKQIIKNEDSIIKKRKKLKYRL
jgi:hypothetical protein